MTSDARMLPATVGTPAAARLYGVNRGTLWAAVREGNPPTPVVKVGRRVRWPLRPIMAQLGLTPAEVFAAIDAADCPEHDGAGGAALVDERAEHDAAAPA